MIRTHIGKGDKVLVAHSDRRNWTTVIEPPIPSATQSPTQELVVEWKQRANGVRTIYRSMVAEIQPAVAALGELAVGLMDSIPDLARVPSAIYKVGERTVVVSFRREDVFTLVVPAARPMAVYFDSKLGLYWRVDD